MTPPAQRYQFTWRRQHVAVLLAGCLLACSLLGSEALDRRWFAGRPGVVTDRATAAELIDPNAASSASLQRLSLIGPVTAQAIIEYRSAHGPRPFRRPEDLMAVNGVGPGIVLRIRDHLTFDANEQHPLNRRPTGP